MDGRTKLASALLEIAAEAGRNEFDSYPLVELGCLALIQGLALDRHRQSLMAHVFHDMVSMLKCPETGADRVFTVPKTFGVPSPSDNKTCCGN